MAKKRKTIQGFAGRNAQLSANVKTNAKAPKYESLIVPKAIAQTRKDIKDWNTAKQLTQLEDNPKWYLYQQLLDNIRIDALLTSQYKNRMLKALAKKIELKKPNGEVDEEQTKLLNDALFTNEINRHILDSNYQAHSLIEFSFNDEGVLCVGLIPRANVDVKNGAMYPDYTEDKKIFYRDTSEYGTWLLEFGEPNDYGLLNSAVPHVLMKRFAQSCWSELCEIYGIPPRVMKTNTQDPAALKRAESMMRDMGAAAWFIIDENEKFEWAQAASTNGDVYQNLIKLCNNEISLLFTGAVIGQDTKNGSRSKDQSGQEMLNTLIQSDLELLKKYWNSTVIPALIKLGVLKGELTYGYAQTQDLNKLWEITKDSLQYFNVDGEWIKGKFGVEITGERKQQQTQTLNLGHDFLD